MNEKRKKKHELKPSYFGKICVWDFPGKIMNGLKKKRIKKHQWKLEKNQNMRLGFSWKKHELTKNQNSVWDFPWKKHELTKNTCIENGPTDKKHQWKFEKTRIETEKRHRKIKN
jgi:hypothetical protein